MNAILIGHSIYHNRTEQNSGEINSFLVSKNKISWFTERGYNATKRVLVTPCKNQKKYEVIDGL